MRALFCCTLALILRCLLADQHPNELVLVGGLAPGSSTQTLALDTCTGTFTALSSSNASGPAPSFIAWQPGVPAVQHLFVANEGNGAEGTGVRAVVWEAAAGAAGGGAPAATIAAVPGRGGFAAVPSPTHVAVARSGRWVLTAGYNSATVSVVPVGRANSGNASAGGQLGLGPPKTLPTDLVGKQAHQVALDPSGRFLYVPCLGSNWVRAFQLNDATGELTPLSLPAAGGGGGGGSSSSSSSNVLHLPPGSGPRHMAFHPTLAVAYVICERSNSVARLDWDRSSGQLAADFAAQPQRVVSTLPPGAAPGDQAAAELAITADGRFLYASNRGSGAGLNSVAVFGVAPGDGTLSALGWEDGGGSVSVPRHISLAAGDNLLLVADQGKDSVTSFRRDPSTGLLSAPSTQSTAGVVSQPSFVGVVPSGGIGGGGGKCG